MWARRVGVRGTPTGGWSSTPPPVTTQRQDKADARIQIIVTIIIDVIMFDIVYPVDIPQANPGNVMRQYLTYPADADAGSAFRMQTMTLFDREKCFLTNDILCVSDSRVVAESVGGKTGGWHVGEFTRVGATMDMNSECVTYGLPVYHRRPTKDNLAGWYLSDDLLVCMAVMGNGVPGFSVRGDPTDVEPLSRNWQEYYLFPGVYTLTPEDRSDGGAVDSQAVVVVDRSGIAATEDTTVHF